ncbi:MAG: hypothetical protein LBI67_11330 [Treponema sp.]|nr:hypothetical protein [Treponema sp.]
MALQELSAKLQLKFGEYIETWSGLLSECYSRGLDKSVTGDLDMDEEALVKYSMELASVILVIGMRLWMGCKVQAEVKEKVRLAVVDAFYREIYGSNGEFLAGCADFFSEKYKTFAELCPHLNGKDREKQRMELVGMARYICAQVSAKPEERNVGVFERLGVVLDNTAIISARLSRNTSLDIQFPLAKPKFIVQK